MIGEGESESAADSAKGQKTQMRLEKGIYNQI